MSKYRFKTEEEFKRDGLWNIRYNVPDKWNEEHEMDEFYGQDIPAKYNASIKSNQDFEYNTWIFQACDCIIKQEEPIDLLSVLEHINQNSLITKKKTKMLQKQ